jgi:sugar phosphate isomerase/epimerase
MKIGFPNHPRKDIIEEIHWIGKNGFDFIDLFLEDDKASPEKINIDEVKKLLKKYKLDVVGHTAWYLPIGSPSKFFREAAVSEAKRCFEVFSNLNARYVTIHGNWPPKLFSPKEGIKFQVDTLKKLVKEAKKYNIYIMYEPIDTQQDTVENVSQILNRVPELFLHIDIGHANMFGRKPEEFIKRFHKKLKHIHLHDNEGTKDLHLPIGTGKVDWERVIKILKKYYNGTITLEIFSQDRDYVLLSKKKLEKLWKLS